MQVSDSREHEEHETVETYRWRGEVVKRLDKQECVLKRIETAMFAEGDDNEFNSPGVMTVLQKINHHVDVVCSLARAVKRLAEGVKWAAGVIAAVAVVYGAWATIAKL